MPCNSPSEIYHIRCASFPNDIPTIQSLFSEYIAWLDLDLTFQGFAEELSSLPGKYDPNVGGDILLATAKTHGARADGVIGCVALRALRIDTNLHIDKGSEQPSRQYCEMKRLYTLPGARGTGLGRLLVTSAITRAKEMGYDHMYLDTLGPKMGNAIKLYRSLGFVESEAYYETPLNGTVFMILDLEQWKSARTDSL